MKYACNRNALAKALIRVLEKEELIGEFVSAEQCRRAVYRWVFYGNPIRALAIYLRVGYFVAVIELNDQVTIGVNSDDYEKDVAIMTLIKNQRYHIQKVHAPWFYKALYNTEDSKRAFGNICHRKDYLYNNERFE